MPNIEQVTSNIEVLNRKCERTFRGLCEILVYWAGRLFGGPGRAIRRQAHRRIGHRSYRYALLLRVSQKFIQSDDHKGVQIGACMLPVFADPVGEFARYGYVQIFTFIFNGFFHVIFLPGRVLQLFFPQTATSTPDPLKPEPLR